MRYLRAFGAFWYDFLVGDRPELFVAPIVVLVLVWIAIRAGLGADLAALGLTVLVLLVGAGSLIRATRGKH
jgi:hypothetical protein